MSFREPNGAVTSANMKRQEKKSIHGPLLRGLTARSVTGKNGQAATKEEMSPTRAGLDVGKYSRRSGGEKHFSLDIPFYRTSRTCGFCGGRISGVIGAKATLRTMRLMAQNNF